MRDPQTLAEEALGAWRELGLDAPPKDATEILIEEQCTVYVEDQWGPAVPYPPIDRQDGTVNYGYCQLKRNPNLINEIPELQDCVALRDFIKTVNSTDSPIETVGCEKTVFRTPEHPVAEVKIGSYVDIVFSENRLNENAENHIHLSVRLVRALEGSANWWSGAEFGIQRLKGLGDCLDPWGLILKVQGYGRTEDEAWMTWSESMRRIEAACPRV